eukprot:SAG11_NODE_2193_length_3702_cov_6.080242_4_plen_56_part_00
MLTALKMQSDDVNAGHIWPGLYLPMQRWLARRGAGLYPATLSAQRAALLHHVPQS